MSAPTDFRGWKRFLLFMQYLWLPLLPLFIYQPTRIYAICAVVVMGLINIVGRRTLNSISDIRAKDKFAGYLRTDESLLHYALASEWHIPATFAYLAPSAFVALTNQRLIVTNVASIMTNPVPGTIIYEAPVGDVRLIGTKAGRWVTKFSIRRKEREPLKLRFRRAFRKPGAAILQDLLLNV